MSTTRVASGRNRTEYNVKPHGARRIGKTQQRGANSQTMTELRRVSEYFWHSSRTRERRAGVLISILLIVSNSKEVAFVSLCRDLYPTLAGAGE